MKAGRAPKPARLAGQVSLLSWRLDETPATEAPSLRGRSIPCAAGGIEGSTTDGGTQPYPELHRIHVRMSTDGMRASGLTAFLLAFTALLAAGAQAQTTLPVGGAGHAGRIDAAGEVDRFEVPWVEHTHAYRGRYRVDVDVSAAGSLAVDDVGVRVFHRDDPDRLYRTEKVVDAPNDLVSFLFYPAVNGTAWLEVFSAGGNSGGYRVSVAKDATEPVDDQSEPAEPHWYQQLQIGHALQNRGAPRSIAVGAAATGEIEAPGDGDWFGVALTADMAYTTTLDVDGAGGKRIQLFGLFDANGGRLVEADKHGSGSGSGDGEYGDHLEFTPTVTGTYYLLVGSPAADTGGYTLAVSAGIPVSDDYAISGEAAGWVAVGGVSEGEIERSHDADGFGAFLQPGIEYRIDLLNGDPFGTGGLADPVIRNIAHPQGWRIRRNGALLADDNSGSGANARLDFTPDLRGTYTIRVGGASGGTGTYTLSLMQRDDYAAGVHTTGVAPVPGRVWAGSSGPETATGSEWTFRGAASTASTSGAAPRATARSTTRSCSASTTAAVRSSRATPTTTGAPARTRGRFSKCTREAPSTWRWGRAASAPAPTRWTSRTWEATSTALPRRRAGTYRWTVPSGASSTGPATATGSG